VPLGTAATEQQKKKPYWPGEESDDQSATAKTKTNKPVPSGKSKVTVVSCCTVYAKCLEWSVS